MYYRYVELGHLVLCPVLLGNQHITKNLFFLMILANNLEFFVLNSTCVLFRLSLCWAPRSPSTGEIVRLSDRDRCWQGYPQYITPRDSYCVGSNHLHSFLSSVNQITCKLLSDSFSQSKRRYSPPYLPFI